VLSRESKSARGLHNDGNENRSFHIEAVGLAALPGRAVPPSSSFQLPSLREPPLPVGTRRALPSAVNIILNSIPDGVTPREQCAFGMPNCTQLMAKLSPAQIQATFFTGAEFTAAASPATEMRLLHAGFFGSWILPLRCRSFLRRRR
jgi:hypothetical protein